MNSHLRTLRWIAALAVAVVVLSSLNSSFPLKPRQWICLLLFGVIAALVAAVALRLMPRAVGTLVRQPDLLVPLGLVTAANLVLDWVAKLPLLGALFSHSANVPVLKVSFSLSILFLLRLALAAAYATWVTHAILACVRAGEGNPCAVVPAAQRSFPRALGLMAVGWGVVFVLLSLWLVLLPVLGQMTFVLMGITAVAWNFATAAVLPVALQTDGDFWTGLRAGMAASLANVRRWCLLLVTHMFLLGVVMFFHVSYQEGNTRHSNTSWNVNTFWTGAYENDCHWHGKLAAAFRSEPLPLVSTLLGLLFAVMAVAIKVAIVQRLHDGDATTEEAPPRVPPIVGS